MHEEQQDDNKTKEIRIIQDNGIWKVINHEGRTLDATRSRAEAEQSVAVLEHFPEYGGRWPWMLLKAQLEVASHLAEAQQQLARAVLACGDYFYLARIRQQLELLEQEMVRLSETV